MPLSTVDLLLRSEKAAALSPADHDANLTAAQNALNALIARVNAAEALVNLTDNSGGTADSTVAAIPDPGAAPGTATVLRDDLAANVLPPLRNAVADLAAKVNALLAALRT